MSFLTSRSLNETKERATIPSATVPMAKARGAALPAALTTSGTLNAIAMVGPTIDKESATASAKPSFRWNLRDLTGIRGGETTQVLLRATALFS
jgi:hypothetical protein